MSAYQVKESVVSASARIVKRGDTYVVIESSVVFPEGIWEHIRSYIPKQDHPHKQSRELLTIWFEGLVKDKSKKDVALILRNLLDERDNYYSATFPETSKYKTTTKKILLTLLQEEINRQLKHSLCVWKTDVARWKPVKITKISPDKMRVAKTLFDMMRTQLKNERPSTYSAYIDALKSRNQITP
jgi:hypothetical protein